MFLYIVCQSCAKFTNKISTKKNNGKQIVFRYSSLVEDGES